MKVEISVDDEVAAAGVIAVANTVKASRPMMEAVGGVIANRIRMTFTRSTSPYGVKWAPLKMRKGQPLLDTGRLRRSITYAAGSDSVVVGTNVRYAPVHQFGAVIVPVQAKLLAFKNKITGKMVLTKKVVVPPRPFMPLVDGAVVIPPSWRDAVKAAITKRIAAAKGGGA